MTATTSRPKLVPNLLGMWVYTDDACPRFDPPKLIGEGDRWYINTADVDAFYRWEAAQRPFLPHDPQFPPGPCNLFTSLHRGIP